MPAARVSVFAYNPAMSELIRVAGGPTTTGDVIFMHGLHPRPPEPIRDQDSTPRDAELVRAAVLEGWRWAA